MQMVTEHVRWAAAPDERPLLAWAADRATVGDSAPGRHLAPVTAVGRSSDGVLVVDVLRPPGTVLAVALDVLGAPTIGVAVTLTVPLLELAVADRSGAVLLGSAGLDDVLVDDAGAVVLCDRPPGASTVGPEDVVGAGTDSGLRADAGAGARTRTRTGTRKGTRTGAGTGTGTGAETSARPGTGSGTARRSDHDGGRLLVLAARTVWERTDARDPVRPSVDAALAAAVDGGVDAVRAALAVVRTAAAPRPVRWGPPASDFLFVDPGHETGARPAAPRDDVGLGRFVVRALRDAVERGVPVGAGRRVPFRQLVVGVVVAVGVAAAAVFALG